MAAVDVEGLPSVVAPPSPQAVYNLLEAYFASRRGFWLHQYESFEAFMTDGLTEIITNQEPIQITNGPARIVFRFKKVSITRPHFQEASGVVRPVLPSECIERRLTYACGVMVDISQENYRQNQAGDTNDTFTLVSRFEFEEVPITTMPCPVRSRFCWLYSEPADTKSDELGGYYIVNGQEKFIISQIKLRPNMIHVFRALKTGQSTTKDNTGQRLSNHTYEAEVRSVNEFKYKSTSSVTVSAQFKADQRTHLIVHMSFLKCDLPLVILLAMVETRFTTPPSLRSSARARAVTRSVDHLLGDDAMLRGAFSESLQQALAGDERSGGTADDERTTAREASEGTHVVQWIADHGVEGRSGNDRHRAMLRFLRCEMLPHLGTDDVQSTWEAKWIYLTMLGGRALFAHVLSRTAVTGRTIEDDRDHWTNKRAEPAGMLIGVLFRQNFSQWIRDLKIDIHKHMSPAISTSVPIELMKVTDYISPTKLEARIRYHLSSGVWTVMRGVSPSAAGTGVCAALNRMTPITALSCLNRVNVPVNREGKSSGPRQVHTSDWGNVCVVETPEGQSCGLVLNYCMLTHVRVGIHTKVLSELVRGVVPVVGSAMDWLSEGVTMLFVNGSVLGSVAEPEATFEDLRRARRCGQLPAFCSLVYHKGVSIHVNCDSGVCVRPVVRVDKIQELRDQVEWLAAVPREMAPVVAAGLWQGLVMSGIIEYVDTEEQDAHCVVAKTMAEAVPGTHTHAEVNINLAIFGVCANIVPFSNHNQSPRIVYQTAMGKQAIGARGPAHNARFDSNLYELHYPQKPISHTIVDKMVGSLEYPSSTQTVVLVAPWGYNEEDSTIFNKASVQRGYGNFTTYKTYYDEIKHPTEGEQFHVTHAFDQRLADYSHLDPKTGVAREGTVVKKGDVIICKTIQTLELAADGTYQPVRRDKSIVTTHDGVIDKVVLSKNREGNPLVRVRVRTMRQPILGDKHACVTPDHEVLTANNEWVRITDISTDDTIATYDPEQSAMTFSPVEAVHVYDVVDEDMYELESQQLSWCVTMNHRMYARKRDSKQFDLIEAHNLVGKRFSSLDRDLDEVASGDVGTVVKYTGTVHCVTVRTGIFLMRRNGKTVLTGNSSHAQKGTIGLLVPPEDLPYSMETGMVPDVIINPHGFVSRMTMGMFYEMLAGKACSLKGCDCDATAFLDRTKDVQQFQDSLRKHGFEPMGNETFIDGKTGEMIKGPLFMGVCSYQALRHLAAEKLNSRARGPRNVMTNQPMDGKSRGGGLRCGEMEDHTLQAHGSCGVRLDRMVEQSDGQEVPICDRCGLIAEPAHNTQFAQGLQGRQAFCRGCRTSSCTVKMIPAATRLLIQELQCMHGALRLK